MTHDELPPSAVTHCELLQVAPTPQAPPHWPQLAVLVRVSMHAAPQQTPEMPEPSGHAVPSFPRVQV